MNDSDETRLATALLAGLPVPSDIAGQLLYALCRKRRGEVKTLAGALGIDGARGVSSCETRRKLEQRNSLIRNIAATYDGDPWEQARAVFDRISRYPYIGEEKTLYAPLFALGVRIPNSKEGLYRILKEIST